MVIIILAGIIFASALMYQNYAGIGDGELFDRYSYSKEELKEKHREIEEKSRKRKAQRRRK